MLINNRQLRNDMLALYTSKLNSGTLCLYTSDCRSTPCVVFDFKDPAFIIHDTHVGAMAECSGLDGKGLVTHSGTITTCKCFSKDGLLIETGTVGRNASDDFQLSELDVTPGSVVTIRAFHRSF